MASSPIKIRCYNCSQLVGVSRSKAGTIVPCPKCGAELDVPGLDAIEIADVSPPASPDRENPIEALDLLGKGPEEIPASLTAIAGGNESIDEVPFLTAVADPPARTARTQPISIPDIPPVAPAIPNLRLDESRRSRSASPTAGTTTSSRDLLIPRTVVASWSILVLAAVAFAFLSGLLAGHFLWRVH